MHGLARVGAVFERREREQKRSGGEGGGPANILVRGIKCSVAFVHRFRFENHWQLLQKAHLRNALRDYNNAELLMCVGWPLRAKTRQSGYDPTFQQFIKGSH